MRSSGLRTKSVSKDGRVGRWEEPGQLLTSKLTIPTNVHGSGLWSPERTQYFKATELDFMVQLLFICAKSKLANMAPPYWPQCLSYKGRSWREEWEMSLLVSYFVIMTAIWQKSMSTNDNPENFHTGKIIKICEIDNTLFFSFNFIELIHVHSRGWFTTNKACILWVSQLKWTFSARGSNNFPFVICSSSDQINYKTWIFPGLELTKSSKQNFKHEDL